MRIIEMQDKGDKYLIRARIICDRCGKKTSEKRVDGWLVVLRGEDSFHYCPKCRASEGR